MEVWVCNTLNSNYGLWKRVSAIRIRKTIRKGTKKRQIVFFGRNKQTNKNRIVRYKLKVSTLFSQFRVYISQFWHFSKNSDFTSRNSVCNKYKNNNNNYNILLRHEFVPHNEDFLLRIVSLYLANASYKLTIACNLTIDFFTQNCKFTS